MYDYKSQYALEVFSAEKFLLFGVARNTDQPTRLRAACPTKQIQRVDIAKSDVIARRRRGHVSAWRDARLQPPTTRRHALYLAVVIVEVAVIARRSRVCLVRRRDLWLPLDDGVRNR